MAMSAFVPKSPLLNQVDAAVLLQVSSRTLRSWQREAWCPDCSGGYDVEALRTWRRGWARKALATSKYAVPGTDDWTVEDWKDLFLTMEGFKRRLAERHAKRVGG